MRAGPDAPGVVRGEAAHMSRIRSVAVAGLAALAALELAGCSLSGGNKAGGPGEPIVLRMATTDGLPGYKPQIDYLVNRVESLSAGNVQIDMVYGVGDGNPNPEQQVARGVAAGTYDLGVVDTRAFDTLGVNSFQALTAPMLIDSYPLEQAVIDSDIPAVMMRSLDTLDVTGLGVLADGLRKPIAVKNPLLGLNDWRGITFAAFPSNEVSESISALGARPSDAFASAEGGDSNLLVYRLNNMWKQAPYVTANVNLWPGTLAVIGNPDRLAGVTSQQRGWLVQAVGDAAARSTGLVDGDPERVSALCAAGTRFATASDADIAALRFAFASVYAALQKDSQTKEFIAEIEELKQASQGQALVIPDRCTGTAASANQGSGSTGTVTKTTEVTPLDGVWEVTYSKDEFVAALPDPTEEIPENYGYFVLTFRRGDYWYGRESANGSPDGTYMVDMVDGDDTITFYATGASGPEVWRYRWSVYRDTLTFEKLGGQALDCSLSVSRGLCEPTGLVVKSWRRVSDS
jgi:TRAP-type transport system periplasmic protein